MPLYSSMPSIGKDMSNDSINQREAQNCSILGSNKKIIYCNSMKTNRNELIRRLLSGITNDELQNLVRVREEARPPIPTPRRRIPDPAPRKMGVKQLIRFFENNPIPPYRPIPAPRTKKQQPVPASKTKIGEKRRALKGFTKSYKIGLKSDRDALVQLQNTRLAISRLFGTILTEIKGFKFVETLKVTFVKKKDDDDIDKTAYFNSRAQIVINPNVFLPSLQLSQQQILNGIGVWLSEGSGWTISSIDEHYINTVVYEPTKGSSYIPPPAELQNSRKGLVNLKDRKGMQENLKYHQGINKYQ